MSYKFRRRFRVNPRDPKALANCDRCGFTYNHVDLQFQYDYRGNELKNTQFLVCRRCTDVPDNQQRPPKTLYMPPDPMPIQNPRPRKERIG